jgi:hypothetical protein
VTFQIESRGSKKDSALDSYLHVDEVRAKRIIPQPDATIDIEIFHKSLKNLSIRLNEFLSSDANKRSILVLGKIQS